MTWHAYRLVYRLKSPLHIGWRKTGNLMQTRPYIPGRAWWGAATSLITRCLNTHHYQDVGDFVRDNLIFSYFFVATDTDTPLVPCWNKDKGQMCYGTMTSDKFERTFLTSQASTAIDTHSNTALDGQLYEVEYIAPQVEVNDELRPVYAVGYLFACAGACTYDSTPFTSTCGTDDVAIDVQGTTVSLFHAMQRVQIGGERTYGFGVLELVDKKLLDDTSPDLFGHPVTIPTTGDRPTVNLVSGQPLPAHLEGGDTLQIQGTIEPLLGRIWYKDGPGTRLSDVVIGWVPGSHIQQGIHATLSSTGVLRYTG